ncbi:MAG: hypothetical protein WCH99_11220 [Verrucomicrobiota bacterium]
MKFIFKWLFRLLLLGIVLAVILVLSLDFILRALVQHNIRSQTGMEAEIGNFHLGLIEPVVTIRNLKLYNPPDFGGTPFLSIPEIHVEYDRPALAKKQIHITLLRFNLGELDIVKNEAGRTNIFSLGLAMPARKSAAKSNDLAGFKKKTGLDFKGVEVLNASVGTAKFIDLKDPRNNRTQTIGIENCVIKNVNTPADLAGLVVLVALRGGDFFNSLIAPAGGK